MPIGKRVRSTAAREPSVGLKLPTNIALTCIGKACARVNIVSASRFGGSLEHGMPSAVTRVVGALYIMFVMDFGIGATAIVLYRRDHGLLHICANSFRALKMH